MRTEFDYSMMSSYMTCQRKYHYRYERNLVGNQSQAAPDFGKGIHSALDSWYVDKDVEKAIEVFRASYTEREDDDKRTYKMGDWILKNYHVTYQDQPWKLIKSETPFALPLPNGKTLIGRIDKIIEWEGTLWIVDHKTTSTLGPTYFKMAEPNLQLTGYTWAAQQLGYNVVGYIVDAILVAKGLLPGTSKSSYLTPLARYDVYREQQHLDEWLSIVQGIQANIDYSNGHGLWIPNFDACVDFGECPYRRVCKEDIALRERIIEADFRTEVWDPRKQETPQLTVPHKDLTKGGVV